MNAKWLGTWLKVTMGAADKDARRALRQFGWEPVLNSGLAMCLLIWALPCAYAQTDAPAITINPVSQIAFVGTNVVLTVSATGTQPMTYQWHKNSVDILAATNATLALSKVATNDSGTYTVTLSNSFGVTTSPTAVVTILSARMWVMGDNSSGELGDGTLWDRSAPVSPLGPAILMAGGASHTLFVKPDHTLWTMGNNGVGQLGDGTTTQRVSPVQVANTVIGLAAGANHSFFIDSSQALWAFGDNSSGQLGDGTRVQQNTPVNVASKIKCVAAGAYHSLFVKLDGTLWAMGNNGAGQLGDGTEVARNSPVQVATNVIAVAAGGYHSLFLTADGTLWAMGANDSGQLGDGTTTSHPIPVQIAAGVVGMAAGAYHSLFLRTDGTLWGMGDNSYSQLGLGNSVQQNSPIQMAAGVTNLAAGYFHNLFVMTDGTLWAMGANSAGQLGDGSMQEQSIPVYVASNVKCVSAGANHSLYTANNLQSPEVLRQPESQSAWVGDTITFSFSVSQEPELSYRWQWRKGGANIAGGNGSSLKLANVQSADSGTYSAVVTITGVTNLTSAEALLVVSPVGASGVFADGQEVIGKVTKTHSTLITLANRSSDGYTFYTLDGSSPNFGSSLYSHPFTVSNSVVIRTLWLSYDLSFEAESPAVTIEVMPYVVNVTTKGGGWVSINPNQDYYAVNASVTVSAVSVAGWTFLRWQGDVSGTNNPMTFAVDGSKHVDAVFGTPLLLNIVGSGSVQVFPSGPVPYGETAQLTALPDAGNTFVVWGNELTGTTNPNSFVVTHPLPVIGALFYSVGAGAPVITAAPASMAAKQGSNFSLSVKATGGPLRYQWYFNGSALAGQTAASLAITNLSPQTTGEYHVLITGPGGTAVTRPVYVSMTDFALRPVMSVYGTPGMRFRVDYSDDDFGADAWKVLTNAILTAPRQDVVDFSNTNSPKRFYRVINAP